MDDENICTSPSTNRVDKRRRSASCGILTPSKQNIIHDQADYQNEVAQQQAVRRKQLEARMNARREAFKIKRQQIVKTKAKFDASETAQLFLNSTGLPTHSKPSLSVYDIEEQKSKQLTALSKWINHLVGVDYYDTAEVESLMVKTKTEATKYLRDLLASSGKNEAYAQTRSNEDVTAQMAAKERKMVSLQRTATALFLNSSFPSEIDRLVQTGHIAVRTDKKVFSDIGLQTEILQLFLSFHPIWLHLGLQVITGKKLVLTTKRRAISSITRFIQTNIMSDESILSCKKYAIGKSKNIITPEGMVMLHRHFIGKMCHFLIAVELMRSSTLVPQVKCLFLKNSVYKCFNDVYSMLSREILAGSTNIPKVLKKIGFAPDFKQGFFEEYDYTVRENFPSSLADGFTLGKITEVVAAYEIDEVIRMLRNPGGDRLRKLGNLRTVLHMARQGGIDVGDIKPENILLGDVNTVLELLWRMIGFYAESTPAHSRRDIQSAALKIQAAFRGFLVRQKYATQIKEREQKLKNLARNNQTFSIDIPSHDATFIITNHEQAWAATVIQAVIRGFLARKRYVLMLQEHRKRTMEKSIKIRNEASVLIQAVVRGFLARRRYVRIIEEQMLKLKRDRAIIAIQVCKRILRKRTLIFIPDISESHPGNKEAALRGFLARQRYSTELANFKRLQWERLIKEQNEAAVVIQAALRGFLARRRYSTELANFKRLQCERLTKEQNEAAVVIQAVARGFLTRCLYFKMLEEHRRLQMEKSMLEKNNAAVIIQAAVRGYLARLRFTELYNEYRIHMEMRMKEQKLAAVLIQKLVRGYLARRRYAEMLREYEQVQIMRRKQAQNRAAVMIQATVRMFLARRKYTQMISEQMNSNTGYYTKEHERAVITIQTAVRGFLTRCFYSQEISERKMFMVEWRTQQAADPDIDLPIYDRMGSCLEALLDDSFKVRMLAACNIAKFAWLSSRCAEYIAENNGVPVIIDSMNNVNRGICTEDALEQLGSILLVLVQSRSHVVRSEVRKRAEAIVSCVFHHIYAHHKSEKVLNTLGRIVLGLVKLRISPEHFAKVRFHRKKIWEKCSKLPDRDSRRRIISEVVKSLDAYN
ncbi:hypothetical protein QR680_019271 [Steinernema hermaphroditum]|uniref:Calponin-homology (CH) domain-containing protein n=1 Tax=Steinernema hermaphroditum TaxID=289476 RepID=A0AA39LS50_9BILA|nr:hypothetical protein QR680_019271 [Steinernema hermaphroditum]